MAYVDCHELRKCTCTSPESGQMRLEGLRRAVAGVGNLELWKTFPGPKVAGDAILTRSHLYQKCRRGPSMQVRELADGLGCVSTLQVKQQGARHHTQKKLLLEQCIHQLSNLGLPVSVL